MHQFLRFILFCSSSLHVWGGLSVHHQESKTAHTASGMSYRFCWLLASGNEMFHLVPASKQSAESVWHIPGAVCIVLDSWWWTEKPAQTCRMLLHNKINLKTGASCWFYYRNWHIPSAHIGWWRESHNLLIIEDKYHHHCVFRVAYCDHSSVSHHCAVHRHTRLWR
jgi:hypothetical protein